MIKRVVEIGSESQLHVSNCQLMIRRRRPLSPTLSLQSGEREQDELIAQVPLDDLGVLVLDNAMITYTLQLLQECAERNVAVVFCDGKHLPRSLLQPLWGNTLHSRTVGEQINVSEPVKKRLWQAIVIGKILAQAQVLEDVGVDARYLMRCADSVKSGDSDNQESQAASVYWKKLFGEGFRRNPDAEGINSLLNYGYAVVRASVARSIVGTGLHPALGLHHHNQYDAYCLADDLMEPFRPAIDRIVFLLDDEKQIENQTRCENGEAPQDISLVLDKETKRRLLSIFETKWKFRGKRIPFFPVVQLYCAGFRQALLGEKKRLEIPKFSDVEPENKGH